MQYVIVINNSALEKNGIIDKVDPIDMCIYSSMKAIINSRNSIKHRTPDGEWTMITNKFLIEDQPLTHIKTERGIRKRINNLIDAGLIERHPDSQKIGKSLYRLGELSDQLESNNTYKTPTKKGSSTPGTTVPTPTKENDDTSEQSFPPLGTTVPTPRNDCSDNNIYTYKQQHLHSQREYEEKVDEQLSHAPTQQEQEDDNEKTLERLLQWIAKNAPYIYTHYSHLLTYDEYKKLAIKHGKQKIADTIEQIENRADLRKRYTNLYRTLLNWLKHDDSSTTQKD